MVAQVINLPGSNIAGRDDLPNNYFSPSMRMTARHISAAPQLHGHCFFIRYSLRDQFKNAPGTLPFPATGGQGQTVVLKAHNVAMALSSSLAPTVFNEFRVGISRFNTVFDIPFTENLNKEFGIRNAPGDGFGDGEDYGMTRFHRADSPKWARVRSGQIATTFTTRCSPTRR